MDKVETCSPKPHTHTVTYQQQHTVWVSYNSQGWTWATSSHLVVAEIVAHHHGVNGGENLFIIEEVDALNAACAVADVTIQLQTTVRRLYLNDNYTSPSDTRPFTPDLKLICHKSLSSIVLWFLPDCHHGSWTCTELCGHWHLFVLVLCARLSWSHSAFESTLNYSVVSYHILYSAEGWYLSISAGSTMLILIILTHLVSNTAPIRLTHLYTRTLRCTPYTA